MNTELLLVYVAVGAMAKLLTMKYPTPGQQWGAAIWITIGALVAGFLGNVIQSCSAFHNGFNFLLVFVGQVFFN